jgi:hypothetical protein
MVNWDALGAVAELLGALGVIATLGYVALQVRQNTASTRSSSYQSAITAVSEWSRGIGLDPDASRIIVSGNRDYSSLPAEDKVRYGFLTVSILRNFENIYYQHKQGAIDEELWVGWSSRIRAFAGQPGFQIWWQESKSPYSDEFVRFLEPEHVSDPGSHAA